MHEKTQPLLATTSCSHRCVINCYGAFLDLKIKREKAFRTQISCIGLLSYGRWQLKNNGYRNKKIGRKITENRRKYGNNDAALVTIVTEQDDNTV